MGRVRHPGDRLRNREIWDGDGGLRRISELRNGGPYRKPKRRIRDFRQVDQVRKLVPDASFGGVPTSD